MKPRTRRIDLALQGRGTQGAFTWGVLDRLLEDERIRFGAISGSSAGAMNAVALAAGFAEGGRKGARESLLRFWSRVADSLPTSARRRPTRRSWPARPAPASPRSVSPTRAGERLPPSIAGWHGGWRLVNAASGC